MLLSRGRRHSLPLGGEAGEAAQDAASPTPHRSAPQMKPIVTSNCVHI